MEANRREKILERLKETAASDLLYIEKENKRAEKLYKQILERIEPIATSAIQQDKVIAKCYNDFWLKLRTSDNIREFCIKLCQRMIAYKRRLKIRPTNAKITSDIDRINSLFDKTIKELNLVGGLQYYISDLYGTIDKMGNDDFDQNFIRDMPSSASQARNKLLEVKAILEEQKKKFPVKRGRTDADDQGFVTAICFAYAEFIGEPTGYEEGPFFNIVTIALDIMGRPSMDPSRSIEKSLAALRTRQASPTKSQE